MISIFDGLDENHMYYCKVMDVYTAKYLSYVSDVSSLPIRSFDSYPQDWKNFYGLFKSR